MELSKVQQEAADFYKGCCNVIAAAGSGKTATLVTRIVNLIEDHDVDPTNILAITFSKKAKENMIDRLSKIIPEYAKYINIETFHSFGYRIIRKFSQDEFEILDADWKKVKIIEEVMQQLFRVKEPDGREIADILSYISIQKNQMKKPDLSERFGKIYKKYEDYKTKHKQIDFDDMLIKCYDLLRMNKVALKFCQEQYQFILADEMQDTNAVQYEMIRLIGDRYKNVFVVGDGLQCWDGNCNVRLKNGIVKKVKELCVGDEVETAYGKKPVFHPITNLSKHTEHEMIEIETASGLKIKTTQTHKYFVSDPYFNDNRWYLYLMYRKDKGYRIGITCGGKTKSIRARVSSEHPERMWILGMFNSQADAGYEEEKLSLKYAIPTNPYFNIGRGIRLTQDDLNNLFSDYGGNGIHLLCDFNMDFNYPNYITQDFQDKNNKFSTVKLTSNLTKNKNLVSYEKNAKKDGFRIRKCFLNFKEAYLYALYLREEVSADMVFERMSADDRRMFNVTCAVNVMPDMEILISQGEKITVDKVVKVKKIECESDVYHVEVEKAGNMIADGIVSHNCIYEWRGSNNQYIMNFDNDWLNTKIIHLNTNYRSSADIIETANRFAQCIPESKHKHYVESIANKGAVEKPHYIRYANAIDEANGIAKKIQEYVDAGYKYKDIAVLTRTNAQLQNFETALHQGKIPYTTLDGMSFIDRREIKIVLCYLRLVCDNNDDEAFEYIYNRPNRFLGQAFLQELKRIARRENISLFYAMSKIDKSDCWFKKGANAICAIINEISNEKHETVGNMIKKLRELLKLDSYISKGVCENDDSRIDNLNTLEHNASNYRDAKRFISNLMKLSKENKKNPNSVQLMTIHKSKGLEFPIVFIAGANQGLLPHEKSDNLNEEKRLMYVAITRAEKILNVSSTARYNGKEMLESEFIKSMF